MGVTGSSFNLILIVAAMGVLPLLAVAVTAFTKFSVVLMILRNALGIQQLPPNLVVYSLAIVLSAYIAAPVMSDVYTKVRASNIAFATFEDYVEAGEIAAGPLKSFLSKHTDEKQLAFFVKSMDKIWPSEETASAPHVSKDDLMALVPAFMLSQLTSAFEAGFLLYLPFLAIDIVVTAILMALGMMMVSPSAIAIPFKLLLFVFVDGWTKVIQGLILSYA